jgi:hypothetical protein
MEEPKKGLGPNFWAPVVIGVTGVFLLVAWIFNFFG